MPSLLSIKGELIGAKEAVAVLKGVKPGKARSILRSSLEKAATPVLSAARQNAVRETGLLKKSMGRKSATYASGTVVVVVGPRRGFKQTVRLKPSWVWRGGTKPYRIRKPKAGHLTVNRDPVKYAHLVEFGAVKKKNKAKPFLRSAWSSQRQAASIIFVQSVYAGLQKALSK